MTSVIQHATATLEHSVMVGMVKRGAECVRADAMYSLPAWKRTLGLTDSAWRELRDAGLPHVRRGKRVFILGRDAIDWFANQGDAGGTLTEPGDAN